MNYEIFDKVHGYIICGFKKHINHKTRSCDQNEEGFYTLELPDFKINSKPVSRFLDESRAINGNKTRTIEGQEILSC